MKRLLIIISIILLLNPLIFGKTDSQEHKSILKAGQKLFQEGKFKECLTLINIRVSHKPEERKYFSKLTLKVLKKLGQYQKALNHLLNEVNEKNVKLVNIPLELGGLYMNLKDFDNAFKWFHIAIDNGFSFYPPFTYYDDFKLLRNDNRFPKLIKRMKDKLGLGKTIKHFEQMDISGKSISPGLFKNTVLLIDFWATWCPPCMEEMDNLKQIYNDFNKKGFAIISISLDTDKKKLNNYIKNFNPPWPVLYSGKGWKDEIVKLYNVKDLPSVWLVDRNGILRHLFLRGKALREAVKNLVSE